MFFGLADGFAEAFADLVDIGNFPFDDARGGDFDAAEDEDRLIGFDFADDDFGFFRADFEADVNFLVSHGDD